MPIYEYECTSCRARFERKQSVTEQPVQTCPQCSAAVRRVYHPVGIVFKGSGFYCTDNRRDSGSNGNGAGPASTPKDTAESKKDEAANTTETKTETKTESKTEPVAAGSAPSKS